MIGSKMWYQMDQRAGLAEVPSSDEWVTCPLESEVAVVLQRMSSESPGMITVLGLVPTKRH